MEKYIKLTFGMIGYVICGGIEIIVKYRNAGNWEEEIFRGTDEKLHSPLNRDLHNSLEKSVVNFIGVEEGTLLIGVDRIE